jgi:hypothetical protein
LPAETGRRFGFINPWRNNSPNRLEGDVYGLISVAAEQPVEKSDQCARYVFRNEGPRPEQKSGTGRSTQPAAPGHILLDRDVIRTRTEVRHNVALGNPEHANI